MYAKRYSVAVDGARRYDVRRCYAACVILLISCVIISRRVVGFCNNNNNEWEISKQCFYS